MKIAMVISSFRPIIGGAERQLEGMLPHMADYGISATVLTRRISGTNKIEYTDTYQIKRLSEFMPKIGFGISLAFELIVFRNEYDLIHCHTLNGQAALVSVIIGRLIKKPVILKVTRSGKGTHIDRYNKSFLGRQMLKILFKYSSKIVAITQDVENELISSDFDKEMIISIPNGVDILPSQTNHSNKKVRIISVGRLIKRKRIGLLIRTLKQLVEDYDIELIIIGDGPYKDALISQTKKLSLNKNIRFIGNVSKEDVHNHLLESHIFAFPSSSEGMSNALLEAMSAGLSVIVSGIPANLELIENRKNGLVFHDENSFRDNLRELLHDINLRSSLGSNARATIERKFSFSRISESYNTIYKDLLD